MSENQNKKILIADSGATKATWVLLDGTRKNTCETMGLHPSFIDKKRILASLHNSLWAAHPDEINELWFYGAGCGNSKGKEFIGESLKEFFPYAEVNVETDLLGACRGLFGEDEGVAVILGTGSNSALFQNGKIVGQHPSLGYILGDEGSGASLGKMLIATYLRREMPKDLEKALAKKFPFSHEEIIDTVYTRLFPNRFLASFCPFLSEHIEHPFINSMTLTRLGDFFQKNLLKYEHIHHHKIRFCGSIAFFFSEQIKELCLLHKLRCDGIARSPMEGLVSYHQMYHPDLQGF